LVGETGIKTLNPSGASFKTARKKPVPGRWDGGLGKRCFFSLVERHASRRRAAASAAPPWEGGVWPVGRPPCPARRGDGGAARNLYRVPEIVTRGRFPDGGESDSTWRTQEARHVGSDTIAPGF